MVRFIDSASRGWDIRLDIGSIRNIKSATQIDLLRPFEGNPQPVVIAAIHPDKVAEIVWAMIRPSSGSVTCDEFFAALDAERSAALMSAFAKEYADFFLAMGRTEIGKAIEELVIQTCKAEMAAVESIHIRAAITGEKSTSVPGSSE